MKKQRILLFSEQPLPVTELPLRQGERCQLTHCTRGSEGVDLGGEVRRQFDWILIDAAYMDGGQKALVKSLRTLGLLPAEDARATCAHPACRVEWDAKGVLHLYCGQRGGRAVEHQGMRDCEKDSYVFEYHAPVTKTG